jgi:hypothetical protein
MLLKYRDGKEANDDLFDRPLAEQHAFVAKCLGCPPDEDYWPHDSIERLLAIRMNEGIWPFHEELNRMMSPGGR